MTNPQKIGDHPSNSPYPIEEHVVTAAGLKLYYHTAGNPNNPPLVFLHGWGIRWKRFGPWCGIEGVIEELEHHFYVIAPELPGLIRSEAPKSYRGYEEYAHIIHALVKTIGVDQPIYLMGNSFGGTIASLYAKDFPEDVKHLILVNAILNFRALESYSTLMKMVDAWGKLYPKLIRSGKTPTFIKKIIISLFYGTPLNHIDHENLRRKQNLDNPLLYMYDMDFERIQAPVLLVWGRKDSKFPVSYAQEVADKMKHAKLIAVPGGHSALYFHPKEVIHAVFVYLFPHPETQSSNS